MAQKNNTAIEWRANTFTLTLPDGTGHTIRAKEAKYSTTRASSFKMMSFRKLPKAMRSESFEV